MSDKQSGIHLTYKHIQLARRGDINGVTALLDRHTCLLNTPMDGHNRTLLWEAVRFHRTDLASFLLAQGANPNIAGRYRNETFVLCNPWTIAISRGYADLTTILDSRTEKDIYTAAYIGDINRLETLCENESNLINQRQIQDTLWHVTPLHHAVSGGHIEAITWLLDNGAALDRYSQLLLDIALRRQREDIVNLLLKHGADPSQAPVYSALQCNSTSIFRTLVANGMDITAKINKRWPPLAYVSRGDKGEHPERVQLLLDSGVDLNDTTPHGMTALHVAARAGFVKVVQLLLEAGADPRVKNDQGKTPYQLAKKSNHAAVMELLYTAE